MEVKDIDIDKIKQAGNVRSEVTSDGIANLMFSIRQDGLLEPIGVQQIQGTDEYMIIYGNRRLEACKKLGWKKISAIILNYGNKIEFKELIIKNTVENIQREDVSPVEQGRIFYILNRDHKMTGSEIGSRFGMSKCQINAAIRLFDKAPDEYKEKIKFIGKGKRKKGNIPAGVANTILQLGSKLPQKIINELFELARQDELQEYHIRFIAELMKLNYPIEEAVNYAKKYTIFTLVIPINTNQLNDLTKKYKKNMREFFLDVLQKSTDVPLDILSIKKIKLMPKKPKYVPNFKVSDGSIPLTDSGSVVKDNADDKIHKNWGKIRYGAKN